MSKRLAVIGGGVAGVAAAWAGQRRGFAVTLYQARAGATELASGVADHTYDSAAPLGHLNDEEREFLEALDYWVAEPAYVSTSAGVVRACSARDPALLDLAKLAGQSIGVIDVERDDWDGAALARCLADSAWARRTGTRFQAVPCRLLREGYERRIAPLDFACLHDDPERRAWLTEELMRRQAEFPRLDALLAGPWLGTERATLEEVRGSLGIRLGECTSLPGGVSGFRFAMARVRLLGKLGVELLEHHAIEVERAGSEFKVASVPADTLDEASVSEARFSFVVLAVGGLVSGGLAFTPRERLALRSSVRAPVLFSISGEPLEQVSSAYGFDPATQNGTWLEEAGVLVDAWGRAGPAGLSAAGDFIAGAPRTILSALGSGLRAVAGLES